MPSASTTILVGCRPTVIGLSVIGTCLVPSGDAISMNGSGIAIFIQNKSDEDPEIGPVSPARASPEGILYCPRLTGSSTTCGRNVKAPSAVESASFRLHFGEQRLTLPDAMADCQGRLEQPAKSPTVDRNAKLRQTCRRLLGQDR